MNLKFPWSEKEAEVIDPNKKNRRRRRMEAAFKRSRRRGKHNTNHA